MSLPYEESFARHETFHPRYGWLRKAVVATAIAPNVFLESDATVTLGVGKNMVRAIRYWAGATGLIEEHALEGRPRSPGMRPSKLGAFLLGADGADPYLEDPTSLWMLHWQLVRRGSKAAIWYLTFNRFPQREFSDEELTDWATREVARDGLTDRAPASIAKDVSCLLRMYSPTTAVASQTLVSPFAALRLVDRMEGKAPRYRITYGPKSGLSPHLVALVALDLLASDGPGTRSIGLWRLATSESSPGRVFALSEGEVAQALEEAGALVPGMTIGVFEGTRKLMVDQSPEAVANVLLANLFPTRPFELAWADVRTGEGSHR
jgi:hypothetical protein